MARVRTENDEQEVSVRFKNVIEELRENGLDAFADHLERQRRELREIRVTRRVDPGN
jgi:c-di-GMP-binding flagellar brake protein YcgR